MTFSALQTNYIVYGSKNIRTTYMYNNNRSSDLRKKHVKIKNATHLCLACITVRNVLVYK